MITKHNESERNVTKRELGKSPYLGGYRSDYGSIIDFRLFRTLAGKSGNQTHRIWRNIKDFLSLYFDYGVDFNPFYDGFVIYTSIFIWKSEYKKTTSIAWDKIQRSICNDRNNSFISNFVK